MLRCGRSAAWGHRPYRPHLLSKRDVKAPLSHLRVLALIHNACVSGRGRRFALTPHLTPGIILAVPPLLPCAMPKKRACDACYRRKVSLELLQRDGFLTRLIIIR